MTWEEARQQTIQQWENILQMIGTTDIKEFAQAVNTCTALCEKAQEEYEKEGKTGETRCYFCIRRWQGAQCPRIISDIIVSALEEDWGKVRSQVLQVLEDLQQLELPPE